MRLKKSIGKPEFVGNDITLLCWISMVIDKDCLQ